MPVSIFRDEFAFHGQLLADFAKHIGKPIDPPYAVTPDNPSQEANGVAVLIPVNQIDEE